MTTTPKTVLIVDDKPDVADTYAIWLSERYDVRTAYNGREALEQLDANVDVVLLDRRMPDLHGDDVLDRIRERGLDCHVAMVTAVEPDFDIVEMGFDTYLVKPVLGDELKRTVEDLLARTTYSEGIREYFSLASKKAVLEAEKTDRELDESEEYTSLVAAVDETREALDATLDEFQTEDYTAAFRDLGDHA